MSGSVSGLPDGFEEQIDSDVDLHVPQDRAEAADPGLGKVLAVVAAGGVLGASARYAATLAWPAGAGSFPWAVFTVNAVGCALIGVLMVLVAEVRSARPLVRPFLGTGVLGGFTTFSAYAADVARLLDGERAVTAMTYAAGTLVTALGAVWAGASVTRRAVAR
ncbi:fluoride efflux transporter CrcB [Streptomyces sp. GC420]|uniref:fluoride efflux transporter CrcB n=1 Tax=Streptomyces sp. GC420 TaxID=2697568 RepID=UPI001414F650|nr:fluoride efflux transporter CrcB [Streptomyces sp. GC420]NBM20841.1 fluoride efflux transporter CrcB [Streptomyces sp. GC420]